MVPRNWSDSPRRPRRYQSWENVRARIRNAVRRVLRKQGYPLDKQEKATQTVLEQAELLSEEWANS